MPDAVYRMMTLLCALAGDLPIGTNLGLLHLLWMLVSGRLLAARGALFPGLSDCGLSPAAVRRAWAAVGQGGWHSEQLLTRWAAIAQAEGHWQPERHGDYRPVALDVTGFWRPRLRDCPTTHYHGAAGKALPAIPVGLIARVGRVGTQRLAPPAAFVRAEAGDPSVGAHQRRLVREAVRQAAADELLVLDGGFPLAVLPEAGATRYVARVAKNSTFRRATPAPYPGRGRPATRGALVRPLPRGYRGRTIAASPPDRVETWTEGDDLLRAEVWEGLVRPDATAAAPSYTVVALHQPRHREPLLLATPLPLAPRVLRACYADRWPVEQLPLAAQPLVGASRQFVSAPEACQRLPELALLAGAVLSYAAATGPALPTGCWDRRPQPTPGRLRRYLARCPFPHDFPLPARIRAKASPTDHLRKGFWGQRRGKPDTPATPPPLADAA